MSKMNDSKPIAHLKIAKEISENEIIRNAFVRSYGAPEEYLDTKTWLNWFGVFVIGFQAGIEYQKRENNER